MICIRMPAGQYLHQVLGAVVASWVCIHTCYHFLLVGIVEGTTRVTERISVSFQNETHKIFILSNTVKADNGRNLTCAVSEIRSPPVTVTILCEWVIWIFDLLSNTNTQSVKHLAPQSLIPWLERRACMSVSLKSDSYNWSPFLLNDGLLIKL